MKLLTWALVLVWASLRQLEFLGVKAFERHSGIIPLHNPHNPLVAKCADGLLDAVAFSIGTSTEELNEMIAVLSAAVEGSGATDDDSDSESGASRKRAAFSFSPEWMTEVTLIKPKTKESFIENYMRHQRMKKVAQKVVSAKGEEEATKELSSVDDEKELRLQEARATRLYHFVKNSFPGANEEELSLFTGSLLHVASLLFKRVAERTAGASQYPQTARVLKGLASVNVTAAKRSNESSSSVKKRLSEATGSYVDECDGAEDLGKAAMPVMTPELQRALGESVKCENMLVALLSEMDLPEILVDALPGNLLTFLSSKTVSTWLALLFGRFRVESACLLGEMIPSKVTVTPNDVDLVSAACKSLDYAVQFDVNGIDKSCRLESLLESPIACKDPKDSGDVMPDCANADPEEHQISLPTSCSPSGGAYAGRVFDPTKDFLNLTYVDLLAENGSVLPDYIPDEVIQEEGLTHFFLYRSLSVLDDWRKYGHICDIEDFYQDPIPGWNVTFVFELEEENEYTFGNIYNISSTPFLFGMRPKHELVADFDAFSEKCQVAFAMRGTSTIYEWTTDVYTRMQPVLGDGIEAHMGFASIYTVAMGSVRRYVSSVLEECGCGNVVVIVSGHSLGGGVGTLMALDLARTFESCAKVHATLLGTPVVLNEAGAKEYGRRVNGRLFASEFDMITQAPCPIQTAKTTGWPLCPESNMIIPMSDTGVVFQRFSYVPGRYVLKRSHFERPDGSSLMPFPKTFLELDVNPDLFNLSASLTVGMPGALQLATAHTCTYGCYLSTFCDGGDWTFLCSDECEVSQESTMQLLGGDSS